MLLLSWSRLKKIKFSEDVKTEEDKQNIDKMMNELVSLINKKDQLAQKLISHEAE